MISVFLSGMNLPKMRTEHTSSVTKRDLINTNMRSPLSLQISLRNIQVQYGSTCFGTSYLATIAVRMLMGEGTAPSVEWDLNLGIGRSTLHVLLNPVCREEKAACAVEMIDKIEQKLLDELKMRALILGFDSFSFKSRLRTCGDFTIGLYPFPNPPQCIKLGTVPTRMERIKKARSGRRQAAKVSIKIGGNCLERTVHHQKIRTKRSMRHQYKWITHKGK